MTELDPTRAPGDLTAAQIYHYRAEGAVPTAPGAQLNLTSVDGHPLDTGVTQAEWANADLPGTVKNCALLPPGCYLLHRTYTVSASDPADAASTVTNAYVRPIDHNAVLLLSGGAGNIMDSNDGFGILIAPTHVRLGAGAYVASNAPTREFSIDFWAIRVA